eukprot:TRINITY_DN67553_c7_g1_i1.p1 TRINITY_DN67553_c7_g1~~TRINITY_DN67553_c7_g1_i1.p1  ORF type:complete len:304 (-),score=-22.85 TRINITY_DN67553_c7_g1_i1:50-961(-)
MNNNMNNNMNNDDIVTRDRDFSFSKDSFTPSIDRIYKTKSKPKYGSHDITTAPPSTVARPNYEDILRRVSVVIHQHIMKCEVRYARAQPTDFETGVFYKSKLELFSEENYLLPKYCYDFTSSPIARLGFQYTIRKLKPYYKNSPTVSDVHSFLRDTFIKAQLSPECSIVCLIYCEKLMEDAHVPLVTNTWRPVLLCGLLLASKVWQDVGTWNIDMAEIFPQYGLQNINKLERIFCSEIKWDLYISPSVYAKYYFAIRSITEKKDFRQNYNRVVKIEVPEAEKIANRTVDLKQDVMMANMAKSL